MNRAYIKFPEFRSKAVTLSYDDGVRQDKRLIEIMKKNGLRGTFNINGGLFGDSFDGVTTEGRMTVEEALALYIPSGMEVAVHGYRHLSMPMVAEPLAMNDIVTDRRELERIFGGIIDGMAYGNGVYDDASVEILKRCGIKYARTTLSTENFNLPTDWLRLPATCHHNNPRLMELARRFAEAEPTPPWRPYQLQMFYLWGHSYEFDRYDNWHVIEEFAEYIGGRDDIWYATNGEIYDYLLACDRLEFSIDCGLIYNPSCTDVYIDFGGERFVVPAGGTKSLARPIIG